LKPQDNQEEGPSKIQQKFNKLFDKFTNNKGPDPTVHDIPLPRFYANVCPNKPPEYSDYENSELVFGPQDDYEFTLKLGRGRYSEVFRAVDLLDNQDVVVKILKPVKKLKVRREIKILETVKENPFTISMFDVVADPSTKTPSIVFEFVDNTDFRQLWPDLTIQSI